MDDNSKPENNLSAEDTDKKDEIKKKSSNLYKFVIGILAVIGLLYYTTMPTKIENAADFCLKDGRALGFSIDEDGKGAYMDGAGEDEIFAMDYSSQRCILRQLDVPSSVTSRIGNTNSLMGMQEAEWDNVSISWTYHPDNGLDVSIDLD